MWCQAASSEQRSVIRFRLLTFKRLLHFGSCSIAYSCSSAEADREPVAKFGRQCAGYLSLARKSMPNGRYPLSLGPAPA